MRKNNLNKKKLIFLFSLCVFALINFLLIGNNRDRSNSPTWEDVERAFNARHSNPYYHENNLNK